MTAHRALRDIREHLACTQLREIIQPGCVRPDAVFAVDLDGVERGQNRGDLGIGGGKTGRGTEPACGSRQGDAVIGPVLPEVLIDPKIKPDGAVGPREDHIDGVELARRAGLAGGILQCPPGQERQVTCIKGAPPTKYRVSPDTRSKALT